MKTCRKITSLFLAAVLALAASLAALNLGPLMTTAHAAEDRYIYYYDQLTDEAKPFYDAMVQMYEKGIFKSGTGDFDLSKVGLTSDRLAYYKANNKELVADFSAARDAFYVDYPDIFYVNFSNLSIRFTVDKNGTHHAYMGPGHKPTYYTPSLDSETAVESAVSAYESALNEVVKGAQAVSEPLSGSLDAARVKYVHDYITKHTTYRLEDACKPENVNFIRTAYGSLVTGEGVCEAYSRALKSVLDRLGIPCVLVDGTYRHTEEVVELHMWAYVQIDGQWYGVDATMDDPYDADDRKSGGIDGHENQEYLLVGATKMNARHTPCGIMSAANYEFRYPELAENGLGVETLHYTNGLDVYYDPNGIDGTTQVGEYKVSYKGMGCKAAVEQGYYLIIRFTSLDRDGEWFVNEWSYVHMNEYDMPEGAFKDSPTELDLVLHNTPYVEFGITDRPPDGPLLSMDGKEGSLENRYYHGDPNLLLASTGMLYNPTGEKSFFEVPPFIKKATPGQDGRMYIGKTYDVKIEYDQKLKLEDPEQPIGVEIECSSRIGSTTGEKYSRLEDLRLDGEAGVITFKFTPSEMYADDTVFYTFNFTNVVGKLSNKKPNPAVYLCSYPCAAYAYKSQGFDWNVFGKPALLENGDLSTNGWKTSDGSDVADELKDRLVLVASKTTSAQESKMNSMVEDKLSGELLTSDTYNISLTLCKQMVIQTGDGVRVSLGFPEGYGPEHAGVTFKAYHFTRDKLGNITGVEEIPCVITPYGLIITCTSFSPFAIVAAEDTTPPGTALDKTVILSASEGGRIQGDQKSDMYALSTGSSTSVEIKADEGYAIESITVDGKPLEGVYEKNSYSLKLSYGQMASNVATIVDAQFISKQAIERDKARNEQPETEAEAQSGNKATQQPEGTQAPAQDPLPAVPEERTSGTLPGSTGSNNGLGGVSATPTPEWTYVPDPTPKADSARRSGGSAQQPADNSGGETGQPEPTASPQPTAPAPLAPQPIVLPAVNETDEAVNAQPDSLISDLELSADTAPAAADIAASAPQKRGMLYFWIGLAFTAGVGLLSGLLFLVVRSRR